MGTEHRRNHSHSIPQGKGIKQSTTAPRPSRRQIPTNADLHPSSAAPGPPQGRSKKPISPPSQAAVKWPASLKYYIARTFTDLPAAEHDEVDAELRSIITEAVLAEVHLSLDWDKMPLPHVVLVNKRAQREVLEARELMLNDQGIVGAGAVLRAVKQTKGVNVEDVIDLVPAPTGPTGSSIVDTGVYGPFSGDIGDGSVSVGVSVDEDYVNPVNTVAEQAYSSPTYEPDRVGCQPSEECW